MKQIKNASNSGWYTGEGSKRSRCCKVDIINTHLRPKSIEVQKHDNSPEICEAGMCEAEA